MRFILLLIIGIVFLSCRTTKEKDERTFARADRSNEGIGSVIVKEPPQSRPGTPLPPLLSGPADPLDKGAFYTLCVAKDQLPSPQALTLKALLAAAHQQGCAEGERWLRDPRNRTIRVESEELVELQTLTLLQKYPHIQDVYIKIAKGLDPLCPLQSPQICHFVKRDFD